MRTAEFLYKTHVFSLEFSHEWTSNGHVFRVEAVTETTSKSTFTFSIDGVRYQDFISQAESSRISAGQNKDSAEASIVEHPVAEITHAFLAHDWDINEDGAPNHEICKLVAASLKRKGIIVWSDEDELRGDIQKMMCDGKDHTRRIVFLSLRDMSRRLAQEIKTITAVLNLNTCIADSIQRK